MSEDSKAIKDDVTTAGVHPFRLPITNTAKVIQLWHVLLSARRYCTLLDNVNKAAHGCARVEDGTEDVNTYIGFVAARTESFLHRPSRKVSIFAFALVTLKCQRSIETFQLRASTLFIFLSTRIGPCTCRPLTSKLIFYPRELAMASNRPFIVFFALT